MMRIERINDERLILKNMQNIRIAFAIQTLGIIGILGYDFINKGMDGMTQNPLWIVFLVSTVVLAFLSMNVSVDHEVDDKSPEKSLSISLFALFLICFAIGIFTSLRPGSTIISGILTGGIFFISGMIPFLILFGIRKRKNREFADEE